jgi:Fe-S cluster biogenesis protein NfuA
MATPQNLRATGDRIEQLLDELQQSAEPRAFARAEELLRLVTDLYGAGLGRMVELALASSPELVEEFVQDELVSSLMLVHELHPDGLTARVERALESVRPFLGQHGGDVELLDIDSKAGAVLIRLLGSCDGCPSSAVTLQHAVERAIVEAAPEIVTIDVDQPEPEPGPSVPIALIPKPAYVECPSELVAP